MSTPFQQNNSVDLAGILLDAPASHSPGHIVQSIHSLLRSDSIGAQQIKFPVKFLARCRVTSAGKCMSSRRPSIPARAVEQHRQDSILRTSAREDRC